MVFRPLDPATLKMKFTLSEAEPSDAVNVTMSVSWLPEPSSYVILLRRPLTSASVPKAFEGLTKLPVVPALAGTAVTEIEAPASESVT